MPRSIHRNKAAPVSPTNCLTDARCSSNTGTLPQLRRGNTARPPGHLPAPLRRNAAWQAFNILPQAGAGDALRARADIDDLDQAVSNCPMNPLPGEPGLLADLLDRQ